MPDAKALLIEEFKGILETQAAEVQAKIATLEEKTAEVERASADLAQKMEKVRHGLPGDAPLSPEEGDAVAGRGEWKSLSYAPKDPNKQTESVLGLPANHSLLRGNDAADLQELQIYNDAVVCKYHAYLRISGSENKARQMIRQDVDFKRWATLMERHGFAKANEIMNPSSATHGESNLDFTLLSSQLIQKMRLNLVVAGQFPEIPLTRSSQKFPTQTGDVMGVWGGGATLPLPPTARTDTNYPGSVPPFASPNYYSYPTFGNIQFDVEHLMCFIPWNDDMQEDSIVPWLPLMQDQVGLGAARAWDRAILDGDVTATHMDTDTTVSNDFRKAVVGLRKLSKGHWKDHAAAALTIDDLHTLRASLGIFGWNPNLCYFMSSKQLFALVGGATGATPNPLTVASQTGGASTIQTGSVASCWGVPIFVSEFVRDNTDGTGVNGASGNTKSIVLAVDRSRFRRGVFGTVQVESTRLAPIFTTIIQTDVRVDFQPWDASLIGNDVANQFDTTSVVDVPANVLMDIA